MPKKVSKLDYTITNMSENLVHNNIFRIIQGKKHKHFLLNKQNSFSGSISDFLKNLKADSIRSKNTIKTVVDKEYIPSLLSYESNSSSMVQTLIKALIQHIKSTL